MTAVPIWIGILFCVSQSAMFSGLNLSMFSLSRLRLEIEVAGGNENARKILGLREDSNFLLTTILWGNVGVNVILTLLSDSVLAGLTAFLFSTIVITVFGEIMPQAYFSRNALRIASRLVPVLRFYQFLLYPVAKPTALVLDFWLGAESIQYFREHNLRELIKKHVEAQGTDLDRLEGLGALNFLAIDDLPIGSEGEPLHENSIVGLPFENGVPAQSAYDPVTDEQFVSRVGESGKKWVIITDTAGEPKLALDSDAFLRQVMPSTGPVSLLPHCHVPIVVRSGAKPLGSVLTQLKVSSHEPGNNVIENDLILLWGTQKRIITGADILGRLMQGIVVRPGAHTMQSI